MPEDFLLNWPVGAQAPRPPLNAHVEGPAWCWFDGVCDNARPLARQLGLPPDDSLQSILLAGWRQRGPSLLADIVGDFAFILFDGDRLFLVRDAFGSRPLHFAQGSEGLLVSRGPLAIARARGRVEPDPVRLAGFVLNLAEAGPESFFAGVARVEAGHVATFDRPTTGRQERWWKPRLDRFKGTQADAIALMGGLLVRSVEGLLQHASRPALELSAGIDSTLLLGIAAPRNEALLAVSGGQAPPLDEIPGNINDETVLAEEAARALGVDFARAMGPPTGVMDAVRGFAERERPDNNPSNIGWMAAVHTQARAQGADLLIQGMQGNFTTSWTGEYGLAQAIAQRDLAGLATETRGLARMEWRRAGAAVKAAMRDNLPRWVVRAAMDRSLSELAELRHVHPDHRALAPIREREIEHRHLPARWEHRASDPHERLRRWVLSVDMGLSNRAFERRYGFPARDAFANRALVEASLQMPARLFHDSKGDRAIARRLLDPRLPRAIRDGGPPAVQGAGWRHALLAERDALGRLVEWAREDPLSRSLFDLDSIARRLASIPSQPVRTMKDYMAYRFDLAPALTALAFARWVKEEAA